MKNKNNGPTLYFSQFGGERPIPEQFIAAMDRAEERTKVPTDSELPKLSDEIIEARFDTRYENTNEKSLIVVKKKIGRVGPLEDFRTTDQGRSVRVLSTMYRTADTTFEKEFPTATQDVARKDLGNGWTIQEVAVEGTFDEDGNFTPGFYQGVELSTRREDPVPNKFRLALETEQVQSIEEGTVAQPILSDNDLEASERQIAQHRKLLTRLTREGVTLPFSLVSKKTNAQKQLVIVTDTYRLIGTAPDITATEDVEVTALDNEHEVVTTAVVASVFGNEAYSKQIEDLLPIRFRGTLPTTLTRQILAGTASMPTLGTGELKRTEEQVTLLTKLVEVLSRTGVSFPVTIVDKATITEYGGGEVTITSSIDVNGTYSVQTGEGYISSKITKLGEGHELRETVARVAGSWPQRLFARWLPRLQVFVTGYRQVVAKGTTSAGISGSDITEVEVVDGYREDKIVSTQPLSLVDSYVRVLQGLTNLNLPPEITSLQSFYTKGGEAGSYTENGNYTLSPTYGVGSLSLRGSAQASASCIPELGWVVKIPRTQNVPCRQVLLFVANNATRPDIFSVINVALGSPGLNEWPDFRPQPILVLLKGGKVNGRLDISASAHDAVTTDYAGVVKYSGYSRTNGGGISVDIAVTSRLMQIPETIHGNLTILGEGASDSFAKSATGSITCGAATSQPLGGTATASGSVQIISGGGETPGANHTMPSSGYRVHRLVVEPDAEFNRLRVFAEVVNFADIFV
jgi:hypothetical protein